MTFSALAERGFAPKIIPPDPRKGLEDDGVNVVVVAVVADVVDEDLVVVVVVVDGAEVVDLVCAEDGTGVAPLPLRR